MVLEKTNNKPSESTGALTPRAYAPELYQQYDKSTSGYLNKYPGMRGNKKIVDPHKLSALRNGRKLGKSFHMTSIKGMNQLKGNKNDAQYYEDFMKENAQDEGLSPERGTVLHEKKKLTLMEYANLHEKGPMVDKAYIKEGGMKIPKISSGVVGVGAVKNKIRKNTDNVIELEGTLRNPNDLIETADSKTREGSSNSILHGKKNRFSF